MRYLLDKLIRSIGSNESRFLGIGEIDFNDSDQLTRILLIHGVDRNGFKLFSKLQTATELVIKDNRIIQAIQYSDREKKRLNLNIELPISEWRDRKVFYLHKNTLGTHTIGGPKPAKFEIPSHSVLKSPFIYLATIDGTDPQFDWMELDKLHISYPIHEGVFQIFLDYHNPEAPSIINPEVFDYSWLEDSAQGADKVEYILQSYKVLLDFNINEINAEDNQDDYLQCGVPLWHQYPQIPVCPKSGKVMQYVTTINSDRKINLKNTNGIENLPFTDDYLIFGDYGNLFVFYEPASKVMHLNMQF
jgi:hypothetical protein